MYRSIYIDITRRRNIIMIEFKKACFVNELINSKAFHICYGMTLHTYLNVYSS